MILNRLTKLNLYLRRLPDVRNDRVAELKNRLDAGAYHVDSIDVAEKVLITLRKGIAV